MNPNRTYLYRRKAKVFTPAGRCALRLAVSAGVLGIVLAGLGFWSFSLHLQHAMLFPLLLSGVVLIGWLAAFLVLLPAACKNRCSAPFIVYDAPSARLWMLPTFSFTGDPAADAAAADALIDTESYQQYPDLAQATLTFSEESWVIAGIDHTGSPATQRLGPAYQRIGDPAPQTKNGASLAANVICGVLLAAVAVVCLVWVQLDKAQEYRQLDACVQEISALVAQVYPDYTLDREFQKPRPGECYLHFNDPASSEDYLDASHYGRVDITIKTEGESWQVEYLSVTSWYLEGEDLAQPLALCRALDSDFDLLSLSRFDDNWAYLQEEFAAADCPEDGVYDKLARRSEPSMGIYVSISPLADYMDSYYNLPKNLRGYYYFDYNHYRR